MVKSKKLMKIRGRQNKMDACFNFLPHHGVFKMDRNATKCRNVFDRSAKNSEVVSLNGNLLLGPRGPLDLVLLLINFRMHPYIIVGDISRMFHQFNFDPKYKDLYSVLWHNDAARQPEKFRFKRLTMGSVDSPFQVINTAYHYLENVSETHPKLRKASNYVKDHLYVDELLGEVDSVEDSIEMRQQILDIFAMMKMEITKWSSNSPSLLKTIPKEELSPHEEVQQRNNDSNSSQLDNDEDDITFGNPVIISQKTKCLGMSWIQMTDMFDYHCYESLSELKGKALKLTRRGISSIIPQIHDPTGLLEAFILKAKID